MHRIEIRVTSFTALLVAAALLCACSSGGDGGPAAPQCVVSAVNVSPAGPTVVAGNTVLLSAAVSQQNCSNLTVTWSSSNSAVATVSSNGTVTGVTAGTATITANAGGTTGTDVVTVLAAVASVTIDHDGDTIIQGTSLQLTAVPHDGTGAALTGRTITYATSDASVLSVDNSGLVQAVGVGTATITATCEGQAATATITVEPTAVTVTISTTASGAMAIADTRTYTAAVRDGHGNLLSHPVTWSVSDQSIATITQAGVLTPIRAGIVDVRATADAVTGAYTQQIIVATVDRRIAWARVPLDAAGIELQDVGLNATGGTITATRTATGDYTVVFGRMARLDASYVDVTMLSLAAGGLATRCHLNSTQNAANNEDLEVRYSCYATDGTKGDQDVELLVVGGGSLAGRHSFLTSTMTSASHTPPASVSYSSIGTTNTVTWNGTGSYRATFNSPRVGGVPENYFVTTVGAADPDCEDAGWNYGSWVNVTCQTFFGPADGLFSVLMLEAGRPGQPFAFGWSTTAAPPLNTDYTFDPNYQRTSSGGSITMQRTATGIYTVTLPGMAPGSHVPHVQVSPYQTGVADCKVTTPTAAPNGIDATVLIGCENRYSHHPLDAVFTILMLK